MKKLSLADLRSHNAGEGHFRNAPTYCEGCGCEHAADDWVPLEIGVSTEVPEEIRQALFSLLTSTSGPAN
jgi:hypothetical protein